MRGLIRLPRAGRWLLGGIFVTNAGNAMQTLATGLVLYRLTGSAAAFGAVLVLEQVLTITMQLVAGPWVDRGSPKRIGVSVELLRGGALVALAAALLVWRDDVALIVLMSAAIRIAHPFYRASMFSLAPVVVADELTTFNAATNVATQAGYLLGVAAAGVTLSLVGPPYAFLANGLTFLFSALTVALVAVPAGSVGACARRAGATGIGQLVAGWREVCGLLRREAGLGWHLALSTADNVAVILFNVLLFQLVAERFAGAATWLSTLDGAFAVGAIASTLAVKKIVERWGSVTATVLGIGGQAACFGALALATPRWGTLAATAGIGMFNTVSWTVLTTRLQERVQETFRGRVGTVRSLATAGLSALIVPLASLVAAGSLEWALAVSSAVCVAFAAIAVRQSSVGRSGQALLAEAFIARTPASASAGGT